MKKFIVLLVLAASFNAVSAQQAPFADLHCHSLLKPFYSGWEDAWAFREHECPPEAYSMAIENAGDVPKYTQGNFESMLLGNVKMAYVSITPLEYEIRHPKIFRDLEKLRNSFACMVGISPQWEFFLDKKVDYFDDLMGQFRLLSEGNGKPYIAGEDTLSYEVICSKAQYNRVLASKNKLGVLVSIEGGHCLGEGPLSPELLASPYYEEALLEHVDVLKGARPMEGTDQLLPFPICVIGLNHFMYNGLSGHVKTFGQVEGYLLDQAEGLNTGITPLGEKVVARLLDQQAGRRILIDVKHMSVATRKWYYDQLRQMRCKGDTVPVIATHVGVSGESWLCLEEARDKAKTNKDAWLNQSAISLFDEDIHEIFESHGILGIMLDKYRVGGGKGNELVDITREGSVQRRKAYVHLLVANMLEVVDALKCKEAWDIISIGSDFDGLISAMETYGQAIDLPSLRDDLLAYFEAPEDLWDIFPKRKVQRYMFDLTAQQIVDKVMGGNLIEFSGNMLEKHLNLGASEAE